MNVLLLGSTGYLGGNIAQYLAENNYTVYCVVRRTSDISRLRSIGNKNIKLISNDPGQIELTLTQETIDWVINGVCTYQPNASLYGDMLESNVIFPLCVLNLAIKHHVKNYMTMGTGLPEDFNVYSFTKAKFSDFGRFLSTKDGINFAEFRLEMFYGGWAEPDKRFLRSCKIKMADNEIVPLTEGSQRRDIVHVEDILNIIATVMKSDYVHGYRILPIGSGEQHSIREIVEYMKATMKSQSKLDFGAVPSRSGEPSTVADISWYSDIGYKMKYSYFDGLKEECEIK
jgi:CDP-paratose synthetase